MATSIPSTAIGSIASTSPIKPSSTKISLIYPITAFNKTINDDCTCTVLSIAKKILNLAFLIIVPLNIFLLPFLLAYNLCQSNNEQVAPIPETTPIAVKSQLPAHKLQEKSVTVKTDAPQLPAASTILPKETVKHSPIQVPVKAVLTSPLASAKSKSPPPRLATSDDSSSNLPPLQLTPSPTAGEQPATKIAPLSPDKTPPSASTPNGDFSSQGSTDVEKTVKTKSPTWREKLNAAKSRFSKWVDEKRTAKPAKIETPKQSPVAATAEIIDPNKVKSGENV